MTKINLEIREEGGVPVVNSTVVAKNFGKRHDHVMRDINDLIISPNLGGCSWFIKTETDVAVGKGAVRKVPSFDMTREGFTLLAMGWNGTKALRFKVAYIAEFNRMEAALRTTSLDLSPDSRAIIGGISRAVINKALAPIFAQVEEIKAKLQTVTAGYDPTQSVVTDYEPMLVILKGLSVPSKGRHSLSVKCSKRLMKWLIDNGRGDQIRTSRETDRYLFHVNGSRDWLKAEGRTLIAEHKARMIGQGMLPLAPRKPDGKPPLTH
jgi:Rha family phage regulatory protein